MNMLSLDPKQQVILESAWVAFSTYGFRKTSMDDIARGANMSRPALYLHYKNKDAIFRALVEGYYVQAVQAIETALGGDGPVQDRLTRAFAAQGGPAMEAMMNSPHGLELIDTGLHVAGEIVEDGEALLRRTYADWLSREAEAGAVTLPELADSIAYAMCTAHKGVKMTSKSFPDYTERLRVMALIFAQALAPA
ncbi:MAG: TetR family transcriptional regulator [Rhodobacteraceae bacterium]|nr:TetR family transcriptional regulator [Paracoccaceae bacterium]